MQLALAEASQYRFAVAVFPLIYQGRGSSVGSIYGEVNFTHKRLAKVKAV
jgi:hypothetical protein